MKFFRAMPKLRGDRERYNVKVMDNFNKLERSLIPSSTQLFLVIGENYNNLDQK